MVSLVRFNRLFGVATSAILGLAGLTPAASAQSFWPDVQLSTGPLGQGVSVTIDPAGNALATWSDMPDPYHDYVYSNARPHGGPWGTIQQSTLFASTPVLHMAGNGVVTAVWDTAQGIVAADRTTAGTWSSPLLIAAVSFAPFTFEMNAHGDAVVAGQVGAFPIGSSVWAVRRIGGVWQAVTTVSVLGTGQNQVRLDDAVIGGNGDALVVYEPYTRICSTRACPTENYQVHASRGTGLAGGAWQDSGALNPGIGILGYYGKGAVDRAGRAMVMYADTPAGASYPTELTYRLQPAAGKPWQNPVVAYTQAAGAGEGVGAIGAITSSKGQVTILFDDALGIVSPLKAVDGNLRTSQWGVPTPLSSLSGSGGSVVFGQNPAGGAAVAWVDNGYTVYAVTRKGAGGQWTPSQVVQQAGFQCSTSGLMCNAPVQVEVNAAGQAVIGIDSITGFYSPPGGGIVIDRAVDAAVKDQ